MYKETFDRIIQNSAIMDGKPCIRGMSGLTVGMIVGQMDEGVSVEDLLHNYPYLQQEDIVQALRYSR